jgi:hypothetical protein
VVDGAGRLVASHEVDDTPTGYAGLLTLISERCADTGQVRAAMATDSETNLIPLLLAAAGDPLAVGDAGTVAQFVSDEPPGTPEPHRRALALARALQSGVLPAATQPAPRDLTALRPVLAAHRAAVAGRGAAVAMLRELLRELYPAALRTFPAPGAPLALAVLERLASPAEVRGLRDGDVLSQLRTAGHPGAEVDTAIATLRRTVAETSTKTPSPEAVAGAIRNGVASVRAAESAAAGLINVIMDRVEPRTSGRGFSAVPPVSAPPVSGIPGSARSVSGPPVSGVPAGSRFSVPPAAPAPVAGLATSEHSQVSPGIPSGRSVPSRDPLTASPFAASSTPPRPAMPSPTAMSPAPAMPPAPTTPGSRSQGFEPSMPRPQPPSARQPAIPQQSGPAPSRQEPADSRPTAGGSLDSKSSGSRAVPDPGTSGFPRAGLAAGGFPAGSPGNSNGAVLGGSGNTARYRDNASPVPSGPLPPTNGSVAPDQSDAELSLLSPDELPVGPDRHRTTEPVPRYSEPSSGPLAALIEFPGSARRQPPTQHNTGYREQVNRETGTEPSRDRQPMQERRTGHESQNAQPRRQATPRVPAGSPPLGETDGDLLIFAQARSAWFSDDPEDEPGQQPEWRSEADEGWDAAAAASHPTVGGTTRSGLPRRVPSANLVPGTAPNRELNSAQPINRDAAQLAAHTAGYFRGWNQAREDTQEPLYPSARHR